MEIYTTSKIPKSFTCIPCDVTCTHKGDFNKHMLTAKHQKRTNGNFWKPDIPNNAFLCECGKKYETNSGLWKHKKVCNNGPPIFDTQICYPPIVDASNNIIIELLKQNNEFKELLIEQNKKLIEIAEKGQTTNNIINNNTNTINNNNQFNLQFFLNETCKDALNIDEFVNQVKLQLSDLDMIGKVGYVEGITKIFLRNLKALDVCKRPIHCSDLKREVLYIKDNGAWEKDNEQYVKIKKVIKNIEDKNIKQLPQWRAENPTHEDTESKKHMEYVHILIESMGGTPIEDDNKRLEKIIRNIAKEVVIDKRA